jgi:hypothetical protein
LQTIYKHKGAVKQNHKMFSTFVLLCLCLFGWLSVSTDDVNRPTVGVIRWDAWNLVNEKYDCDEMEE